MERTFQRPPPMRCLFPLVFCFLAAAVSSCAADNAPLSHVGYMGEQILLAQSYTVVRKYKGDLENLDAEVISQVERLVRSASFKPTFLNAPALSTELDRLRFPRYGSFYANQLGAQIDPELELVYVEIPRRALNRYVVLERLGDDSLRVVSDFVAPDHPEIVRVHRRAGMLVYEGSNGVAIVPKPQ